jgi:hypothetical protein
VNELVQAMGLSDILGSTVSKLCKDIDERVMAFLDRPLSGNWPYLWLDATYLRQREGGRIVSVAAIIAVGCDAEGHREIVGLHIGPSGAETFWATFLKSLLKRGLKGVKLVVSDAHEGLNAAIARVLGETWQRCRVHWMRNALAHVGKPQQSMVSAALRQAFLQPDQDGAGRPGAMSPANSASAGPSPASSWMTVSMTCSPTWHSRRGLLQSFPRCEASDIFSFTGACGGQFCISRDDASRKKIAIALFSPEHVTDSGGLYRVDFEMWRQAASHLPVRGG